MPQNFNEAFRLKRKKFPQTKAAVEFVTDATAAIHNDYLIFDHQTEIF